MSRQLKILWARYVERADATSTLSAEMTQSIAGIRSIKGYSAERSVIGLTASRILRLLHVSNQLIGTESNLQTLNFITGCVIELLVFYFGTKQVLSGMLTLGQYLTCTLLLAYIVIPVGMGVIAATQLTDAAVAVHRALQVLQLPEEHDSPSRTIEARVVQGSIIFDSVSFTYAGDLPVLKNISFFAEPGTTTAFVGPSGSGKTTTASLLCGFYNVDTGKILVDNVDIATVKLSSYRKQIGIVFQDPFLFHGTIIDNLRFANPNATDDQISQACRVARLESLVNMLPDGYNTRVGERGMTLSAGQRQRIALARVLLANPPILILDEATSNVDPESEHQIREAISAVTRGRTTIIITHRLASIRRANQILLFDGGSVIARGTHSELYEQSAKYRQLCDSEYVV